MRVWDAATGGIIAVMRAENPLESCAWTPDGETLAFTSEASLYLFSFKS